MSRELTRPPFRLLTVKGSERSGAVPCCYWFVDDLRSKEEGVHDGEGLTMREMARWNGLWDTALRPRPPGHLR